MLPPYYFYWFRIDNKHMAEPWMDQALMDRHTRVFGSLNCIYVMFAVSLHKWLAALFAYQKHWEKFTEINTFSVRKKQRYLPHFRSAIWAKNQPYGQKISYMGKKSVCNLYIVCILRRNEWMNFLFKFFLILVSLYKNK